jgi:hypothetical protein
MQNTDHIADDRPKYTFTKLNLKSNVDHHA